MIIGIGSDIVDIRRIEKILVRYGKKFENRCFTTSEQELARRRLKSGLYYNTYAKRFAAKEACVKALGVGFIDDISMKDIFVEHDKNSSPYIILKNGALRRLEKITPNGMKSKIHLSLSDEPPYAQAFVIIEAIE